MMGEAVEGVQAARAGIQEEHGTDGGEWMEGARGAGRGGG